MGLLNRNVDPYQGIFFKVVFPEFNQGQPLAFSKVSGISEETEAAEYRTGYDPPVKRQLKGITSFGDVTFEDGLDPDDTLRQWRQLIISSDYGPGKINRRIPISIQYKSTVEVTIEDEAGNALHEFKILNAWPMSVEIGDLDAGSSDVVIRSVVFKNEGIVDRVGSAGAARRIDTAITQGPQPV